MKIKRQIIERLSITCTLDEYHKAIATYYDQGFAIVRGGPALKGPGVAYKDKYLIIAEKEIDT
ncbi:MAG: hypothetical protein A2W25_11705 [candidate division Zixibacteria bacterium RBG_16_53_22]|nr:MAG: hypothetical protein A2W25_11705 [candidate division Zixibacteria bacterium RBG_16_53_22]